MRRVGLVATAACLPEAWQSAADIAALSGVPERVIVDRFGLRGKHVAAPDEHVSDMAVGVARQLLDEFGIDPMSLDAVVYFGSTYTDYPVWQAAPWIAHRLGASRAFALELDYVSCGAPVVVRVVRDLLRAEPELSRVLAIAASRESHLVDYANERTRFMFNFGDGAVAALFEGEGSARDVVHEVLGVHMISDGSFSLDVKVPAGGSVEPASHESVDGRRHQLDVLDAASMKARLDPVSVPNFVAAARGAIERSNASVGDVALVCGIHMKRSIHEEICAELGIPEDRTVYLDDTGHMSGVDPILGLDRAWRSGRLASGDLVLLLAAGTGYTWAAACLRW